MRRQIERSGVVWGARAAKFLIAVLTLVIVISDANGAVIDFPDESLEGAVRSALESLGADPGATIEDTELVGVGFTSLTVFTSGITNLSGLEFATDFEFFDFAMNEITDISPLATMSKLTTVGLLHNQVTDLSPLAGLSQLQDLNIIGNGVSDISPLAALEKLTILPMQVNMVTHIGPLANKPLLSFVLMDDNLISDISSLAQNFSLRSVDTFDLRRNPLSQQALCIYIPSLRSRGAIANIDEDAVCIPVVIEFPDPILEGIIRDQIGKPEGDILNTDFAELTFLIANDGEITDLTGLEAASNLSTVELNDSQIMDVMPLAGLTRITHLALNGNPITDVAPLASLTSMELLSLSNAQLTSIEFLSGFTAVTDLILNNNTIMDIRAL